MTKTVIGLFDRAEDAEETVKDLMNVGFQAKDISLISSDSEGNQARRLGLDSSRAHASLNDSESREDVEARDAGLGAALGGTAGLLVGLGMFMIPGIGPVIGAGPIIAGLGGAGVGAVTGGIIGALAGAGIPKQDAEVFEEGLRRGGTLVLVNAENDAADRAADVMNRHQPADLEQHMKDWGKTDWKGFNENREAFAFDDRRGPYHMRESKSELDYGMGARSFLPGQGIREYDRSTTKMDRYVEPHPAKDWKMYESRFREHFKKNYEGSGKRWEDYSDAYHFGYDMSHETNYANERWDVIEPYMHEDWDMRFVGKSWADYKEAVHDGWEVGHVPH